MDELMEILEDLRPDVDFETETALIDHGILTSLDIITLVSELSDEFGIRINPPEMTADNFNSREAILRLIERLSD